MPQFIRHHANHYPTSSWVVSALAGILVGFLLAIAANYLKEVLWASNAPQAALAALITPESKPVPEAKKPVRYEAIISNWKQYRSANQTRE